ELVVERVERHRAELARGHLEGRLLESVGGRPGPLRQRAGGGQVQEEESQERSLQHHVRFPGARSRRRRPSCHFRGLAVHLSKASAPKMRLPIGQRPRVGPNFLDTAGERQRCVPAFAEPRGSTAVAAAQGAPCSASSVWNRLQNALSRSYWS